MPTAAALGLYGLLLAAAGLAVWRRPVVALTFFVVGLAVHNAVAASLYGLGVRGVSLTAIQAWKEALLAVALARVGRDARRARRLPFRPRAVDWLAVTFLAFLVLYALVPQSALGGAASLRAVLYALRHDGALVVAYVLGRSLPLGRDELRRLAWTVLATGAAVAAIGLVEEYAVALDWWRRSAVPGYFREQLGLDYRGLSGLPQNFVFNTGDETHLLRRLVSTFLSPLGSAFLFCIALLLAPWRRLAIPLAGLAAAGLLFTDSRATVLALAAGLVVLAGLRRDVWPALAAVAAVALGLAFVEVFPHVAPASRYTASELAYQHASARAHPGASGSATSSGEPSIHSHLASLRAGLRTVVHHPQGFGLGNAGETASRFGIELKAGESTYTELGVEIGFAGMLVFLAFNAALLVGLARAGRDAAPIAAALVAVLVLAVQTDVLGVPWLAFCVWWLAGSASAPSTRRAAPATAG